MLDNLAPARRRLVLGVAALTLLGVLAAALAVVLTRDPAVEPVAQDTRGPVLLVPGYGGSTTSLQVLADALEASGRDTEIVTPPGDGTGDLADAARALGTAADRALQESGAPSVDVIGYSAGGVVVRLWVADFGGDAQARRVITLASPHHGTDLASLAGQLGGTACPTACRQLATDSDLLRTLNADDETPRGARWVAIWTTDDKTVVPPDSGSLEGALDFSVQSICPDLVVSHPDVPRTPAVIAIVEAELGTTTPALPDPSSVCP